jgi:hypothetical protein
MAPEWWVKYNKFYHSLTNKEAGRYELLTDEEYI